MPLAQWQERFARVKKSNILQSYHYAQAICSIDRQKARWGLILIDGQEAGLVQLLEAGILWNALHGVILDRGPLWFEGFGGAAHIKMFFEELNRQFPNRLGRRRRILPEIEDGETAKGIIKQAGLNQVINQDNYQTLWWNLEADEELARQNLRNNWRGSLQKAEKSGLEIEWDDRGYFYQWLKNNYEKDKAEKGYNGPSPRLLDNLAKFSTQENPMIIGKASLQNKDIAGVMFLKHGQSATYQIGWSSDTGRENSAHHLLLWQGRSVLQRYGVKELDLGGVNEETAKGIKKFKEGTGASPSRLVGHYR